MTTAAGEYKGHAVQAPGWIDSIAEGAWLLFKHLGHHHYADKQNATEKNG